MDGARETWAGLTADVRRRALLHRREALWVARRDRFKPPGKITPGTWRSWRSRARKLGFELEPVEPEMTIVANPYTGTGWTALDQR